MDITWKMEWLATMTLVTELGKGEVIPVQDWTGPEGFWRLRLPDFKLTGNRFRPRV